MTALDAVDGLFDRIVPALGGWPASALLTAAMVYALQRLLRTRGGTLAGLLASAPLTSAPALLWLSQARGAVEAGQAAMSGLRLTVVLLLILVPVLMLAPCEAPAVARSRSQSPANGTLSDACCALCAGLVTGGCLAAGSALSPQACGALSCLPWTSCGALASCLRLHGPAHATGFLRGYARGLVPRLAFFGSVGVLMPGLGGPRAVLLGLVAGAATLGLQRGASRLTLRRPLAIEAGR